MISGQVKDEAVKVEHSAMPSYSMCFQPSSMTLVNPKNRGVESPFAWLELSDIPKSLLITNHNTMEGCLPCILIGYLHQTVMLTANQKKEDI